MKGGALITLALVGYPPANYRIANIIARSLHADTHERSAWNFTPECCGYRLGSDTDLDRKALAMLLSTKQLIYEQELGIEASP